MTGVIAVAFRSRAIAPPLVSSLAAKRDTPEALGSHRFRHYLSPGRTDTKPSNLTSEHIRAYFPTETAKLSSKYTQDRGDACVQNGSYVYSEDSEQTPDCFLQPKPRAPYLSAFRLCFASLNDRLQPKSTPRRFRQLAIKDGPKSRFLGGR